MASRWTNEELELLKFYPEYGIYHMMELLPNKTRTAISHKVERLNLRRADEVKGQLRRRRLACGSNITSEDLAWMIGAYTGDGFITNKNPLIGISSIDKEITERFRTGVSVAYDDESINLIEVDEVQPTQYGIGFRGNKPAYIVRIGAAELAPWIKDITCSKSKIPDIIHSASKNIKLAYLAALIDTEGWIGHNGSYNCYVGMKDRAYIEQLSEFATSVGIKPRPIKYNGSGAWVVYFNMASLAESGISFTCKRKQSMLERYISEVYSKKKRLN